MGRSLLDLGEQGAALCVSQFTLYGDTRKGTQAELHRRRRAPELAERLYERFCELARRTGRAGRARAVSAP